MKKNFIAPKPILAVLLVFFSLVLTNFAFAQRDPTQWPFAQNSIWNMPIGSSAVYQPAYLKSVAEFAASPQYQSAYGNGGVDIDQELIIFSALNDPLRAVHNVRDWDLRCGGASTGIQIRFPAGLTYADPNGSSNTPNYSGACIQPDGSVFHFNALATCGTDKLGCYNFTSPENNTLTSEGKYGGHGGSGLSGIGGSIRKGELLGTNPIKHALKLNILAAAYLVYNNDATPGYRWPADRSDGYASPTVGGNFAYGFANPNKNTATYMEMGVLLAIQPNVTAASLGITNPVALKIFQALQDYGAYIVDDTYWNNYDWCMQEGVYEEVQANMDAATYAAQMMIIFKNLNAITNNGPNSIGGGGSPRQPLAPAFGASVSVTGVTVSPTSASIGVNGTQQLTPTVAPSNATNKAVTYSSTNNAIATVSVSGLVTGKVAGNATITVTTTDGSKTAACAVTVTAATSGGSFRIMPLGDSKTEGDGGGGHHSWRGYLRAKLINDGFNIDYVGNRSNFADGNGLPADNDHAGQGGYTIGPDTQTFCTGCETTGLFEHVDTWLNAANPDVVLMAIGVNDFFNDASHPVNYSTTAPQRYQNLVNKILQTKPNVTLVLGTVEPVRWDQTWGGNPSDNDLGALNARIKAIADASTTDKIFFADIRNKMLVGWGTGDYFDDVHLSATGAQKDASAWYDAVKPLLTGGTSTVAVTGVTVSPTTISVAVGASTSPLTATIAPANATNQNKSWSSSNTAVATVSVAGVVSGVTAGSATITATTADGAKTATCNVTVTSGGGGTASLTGTATQTTATVTLSTVGTTDWKHYQSNVYKSGGSNSISNFTVIGGTASSYNDDLRGITWTGGTPTASSTANKNGWYIGGNTRGFSFTAPAGTGNNTVYVYVGGYNSAGRLTAQLSNAAAPNYLYTSSTIPGQYDFTFAITYNAAAAGQTITIRWEQFADGGGGNVTLQAAALVTSTSSVAVTGVTVSPTTASVAAGGTTTLTATVAPSNATNKNVTWSSSNTNFATVSTAGVVTGVAAGSATITVTTTDGAKTATSVITVTSGGGGTASLTGTATQSSATVILSTVGTTGWKHFQNNVYKSGSSNSISNYTVIGGTAIAYPDALRGMTWTGGTPTAGSTGNTNGWYIGGNAKGFSFTAPAGTTNNTVYVYVGGYNSGGRLTAQLSNAAAPNYVYTSATISGEYNFTFAITYNAGAAGQTINIKWEQFADGGGGNVSLQAAALTGTAARLANALDVNESSTAKSFSIYPNPVKGNELHLNLNEISGKDDVLISTFDLSGKLIKSQVLKSGSYQKNNIILQLNGVSAGAYIVSIQSGNKIFRSRIIKK